MRDRLELTVQLRRQAETLYRSYFHPPYGSRPELSSSVPWRELAVPFSVNGHSAPEAVIEVLDRGSPQQLRSHLTRAQLVQVGELQFELLFGQAPQWERILRGLFKIADGPRPNPPRHAVRVRVLSDDPVLSGLPWRVTAWQGKWLLDSDWTFEVATSEEGKGNVELPSACRMLVIAPRCGDVPDAGEHLKDLRETLANISPHYLDKNFLTLVETRDELAQALQGMQPHLVYYYGHGVIDGGQACLLLGQRRDPPEPLNMNDLRRLLGGSPPRLVYLNACKAGAAGWHCAGHQLTPDVPCVVARRTTAWSEEAGSTVTSWLTHFLGSGLDPVVALHRLPPDGSTRGFEWATTLVWTSYRSWQTHREIAPLPRRQVGLRLDRDDQRARALKHVNDLIDSRARRVEAMVVYGSKSALVDQFGGQAKDYLESQRVCLRWLKLDPMSVSELKFHRLEEELSLWLDRADFEGLQALLRRHAPKPGLAVTTPVLCLDWGTLLDRAEVPLEELQEWLLFACDSLARHCPDDIRLLSYLALELELTQHDALRELMEELSLEIRSQRFRSNLLPALADITLANILDYLEDPTNTHCPVSLAHEVSRRIYRRTGGHYESTVGLIKQGEESGWNRLLRWLRRDEANRTP